MSQGKQAVGFTDIFGADPAQWFLSCQADPTVFGDDGRVKFVSQAVSSYGLLEKTKGTVFHFHEYLPADQKLGSGQKSV